MTALTPYLAAIKAACIAMLLLAVFAAGYHSNHRAAKVQAKWDADKLVQAEAAQKAEATYRAKEQSWNQQLQEAQNAAAIRETRLRADADAARADLAGLRDQLTDTRRQLPSLAADAVRNYADAASVVLSECADRYTAVAEDADRLASERQTLIQSWPK